MFVHDRLSDRYIHLMNRISHVNDLEHIRKHQHREAKGKCEKNVTKTNQYYCEETYLFIYSRRIFTGSGKCKIDGTSSI